MLSAELNEQCFTKSNVDHAVFIYKNKGVTCPTAWHVDDGLAGCNNTHFLAAMKHWLHLHFSISDMGPVTKYLGIQC
ncbi:hypothetical protein ID866_9678 [Astraeus odoratus]|nr:hypothetical protein ID866_9678 [Astraeus odoratus]